MKRTLMSLSTMMLTILLAGGLALVAVSPAARADGDCQLSGSDVVCTFTYTGAAQSWTVPEGVTQATFDVYGAQGGSSTPTELGVSAGGLGGKASAPIAVTPDDTLQVNVGGRGGDGAGSAGGDGGFNGGASGGNGCCSGPGGGGGASDVRRDTNASGDFALAERIIVAGGGGGAGGFAGGAGGAGGGLSGDPAGDTFSNDLAVGGGGGTQDAGGLGGAPGFLDVVRGTAGGDGSSGLGGRGGDGINAGDGGGGGGGGYYGGGGGGGGLKGAGGGGGSGFGPSGVEFPSGGRTGNGLVTITYPLPEDSTAPTVSLISRASSNPTNTTGNVAWTVRFSESVTGVDTGDFVLANSGLGGTPTITNVSGSGRNYTVTASTGTGDGTLGLNLSDNDSIKDRAINLLGGTGLGNGDFTGEEYVIDRTAPTATGTAVLGPNFTAPYTANTWTNQSVRVTFTCTDTGGSGLTSASGNDVQTFTAETSGTTATSSKTCKDNAGNTAAAATFGPIKIDKTPPSVSCSVTPSRLRPANNHKLVTVTASVSVTDSGSGTDPTSTNRFTLVSVTSDQADSGFASDDLPDDIQGWTTGLNSPDTSGQLRAERYGGTRTYTLTYRGFDLAGNTKDCSATVKVPKGG